MRGSSFVNNGADFGESDYRLALLGSVDASEQSLWSHMDMDPALGQYPDGNLSEGDRLLLVQAAAGNTTTTTAAKGRDHGGGESGVVSIVSL